MSRYVDLPAEGEPRGRCVVLPGRQYTPDGPLLFFAAQVARAHGWDVRQVWWDPPDRAARPAVADEVAWVGEHLDAAIEDHEGRVLVVAKSLGTLAAARAAERSLEAVWLTPLLGDPEAVRPLRTYPAAQLVVIGSEDPYLDRDVLESLPGERVVVGGDHVLLVPGDPLAMVSSHEQVARALDGWLAGLPD